MALDPKKNRSFREELIDCWQKLPDKALFFPLFAAWLALFHFWGSSTLGYINTPSLFGWLNYVYRGSPDDEHGRLIPFAVLALFWWKRDELTAVPKRIWWPALALVAVGLFIHVTGFMIQVPQISVVALFGGLFALTGLVWGPHWLRASFFPMILFAFMVPLGSLGDVITVPLRLLATTITAGLCDGVLGIDLVRRGNMIFDKSLQFQYEVAAACGGIRSLISMLALTTVYGFMAFRSNWRRSLIILAAFPLAVAGNVFRLTTIIVAAEAFGRGAGDFVHEWLGILPYIPAIAGILIVGRFLREEDPTPPVGLAPKVT
ncbi:MAG: exosortase/archaeosortase family protein [Verrucomicrobia bacterium]|nr:exosortase/archaeosortase family protein [Verrucomicrobiota bacterium]